MKRTPIFVTGFPRSGTTLVDKLLSFAGESRIFSQPLPLLFPFVKSIFLESIGKKNEYPLNDMFLDNYYRPEDWLAFLSNYVVEANQFKSVFSRMANFSGQYTKPLNSDVFLESFVPGKLDHTINQYLSWLTDHPVKALGLKETYCEEYIPYFMEKGFKCIQVIRDPRDSIASLSYGPIKKHGGAKKPLLYNIRSWRKSAAFAMSLSGEPLYKLVKYEDLVSKPDSILKDIFNFLAIDSKKLNIQISQVTDQNGNVWRSNSSFEQTNVISRRPVGRYTEVLPREIIDMITTLCHPEMCAFGYTSTLMPGSGLRPISQLSVQEPIERPVLARYAWSENRRAEEERRLELLAGKIYLPEFFLFQKSFNKLSLVGAAE